MSSPPDGLPDGPSDGPSDGMRELLPAGAGATGAGSAAMVSAEAAAAQALAWTDPATAGLVPGLTLANTFLRDDDDGGGLLYARRDNPGCRHVEAVMARLEGGAAALAFASGMAAATAVFQALPAGSHVVVQDALYWPLRLWLETQGRRHGLQIDFVPLAVADGGQAALRQAVRPGRTALVWVETPANPGLEIVDLGGLADVAHQVGARLAVDSTCASPVLTRPIEHGADLVVHSAGKLLNGHDDVMAGVAIARNADALWDEIGRLRWSQGPLLGPFEAYLLLRSLKTLFLRVRQASASALALARHLSGHPALAELRYPGLPSHPGHAVAVRQMSGGFGVLLGLRLAGGAEACRTLVRRARLWRCATSFGGTGSLIEHRAAVEGSARQSPDDFVRLAVGLEPAAELAQALDQALAGL